MIKNAKDWFEEELSGEPLTQESVIECIKMVQEEVGIKFGRWLLKYAREGYDSAGSLCWYYNNPNDENTLYTTQEIFEIFLENENKV